MKQPLIGILGGLGPQTTAEFYKTLIECATTRSRPAVCIWSLPMNLQKEKEYIATGQHTAYYLRRLSDGLHRLTLAGCSHVVIPCNTVHEFHTRLLAETPAAIANIIDLTADEVVRRGWTSCTVLMTSRTRTTGLYQRAMGDRHITVHLPTMMEQHQLDRVILGLLGNQTQPACERFLARMLRRIGCPHVVLGCTDLQPVCLPSQQVVDSMQVLAERTATLVQGRRLLDSHCYRR